MRRSLSCAWMLLLLSSVAHAVVPAAPTNLTATAASTTQINLSWTDTSNNETSFKIERRASATGTYTQIATVGANIASFSDTGLQPATFYFYRVRASNSSGNSAYTNEANASTLAPAPPAVPTGLTGTAVSISYIQLSWTNPGSDATGWELQRKIGATGTYTLIASFGPFSGLYATGTNGYLDTTASSNTTYFYRVRNTNAGYVSAYSNEASVMTPPLGLVAAYSFSEGSGTTVADSSGYNHTGTIGGATWTSAGRFGSALAFNGTGAVVTVQNTPALRITSNAFTLEAWVFPTAPPTGRRAIFNHTQDMYYLLASTSSNNVPAVGATFMAPQGLQETAGTVPLALNTWTHLAGTFDGSTVRFYVNGVLVASQAQTLSLSGTSGPLLIGGNSYPDNFFAGLIDEVRVYNRSLSQAEIQTDMNIAVGGVADATPPTAPSALSATAASAGQINLSWTASSDNVGVTGYRVERCQGAGCTTLAQIATPTGTNFSDTGLAAATSYSYRVRATDAAGNFSTYSNIASVTTQATDTVAPTAPAGLTASATSSSQINLAWTASTDNVGVTGYQVDRCQGAGCTTFVQVATPTGTSFSDAGLAPSTSYSYRVRATDAAGNISANSSIATATTQAPSDTTAPTAPTGLTATAVSTTQINLTWTASTDNVGVTGYRVERCLGTGCTNFVQIAAPAATSFSNTGLTAGTSYSYRVRAIDAAGNLSGYSNVAGATTGTGQVQAYYIQVDQLNTPRLIEDQNQSAVWRRDQGEPFGNDVPNNNPSGVGAFEFNLRFPGQYFDRESNLTYNYFRDYDPTVGRYVKSDPVGIRAGVNTYTYVVSNPLTLADPRGLKAVVGKTSILDILGELAKPCEYAENLREMLNVLETQSYANYQADIKDLNARRQANEDACRRIFSANPCFNFAECLQATNKAYNDQLRARNELYDEYRRQLADPGILVRLLNAVASICAPDKVYGPRSQDVMRE